MAETNGIGLCSSCQEEVSTNHYHGADSQKIELCKACYDQYLANEMLQYWKDHIEEEKRRVRWFYSLSSHFKPLQACIVDKWMSIYLLRVCFWIGWWTPSHILSTARWSIRLVSGWECMAYWWLLDEYTPNSTIFLSSDEETFAKADKWNNSENTASPYPAPTWFLHSVILFENWDYALFVKPKFLNLAKVDVNKQVNPSG